MLGLPDASVWLAYLLCILSTVLCVVYGAINWNRGGEEEEILSPEVSKWAEEEEKIEETL